MTPFESTLAALLKLPVHHEDLHDERKVPQLAAIALEVSQLKPPRGVGSKDWRAVVLAVGEAESGFSLRIMEGRCKAFECDRGRSRSPWQMQQNDHTRPFWDQLHGFATLHVQVDQADKMLKRAYLQCARFGGSFPESTILAFAGRGCKQETIAPWRGLDLRVRYWTVARQAMG